MMNCVIMAGGSADPESPMYALTQGKAKALLPMGDRTMLERVVDALQGSKYVDDIIVVGLGGDMGMTFQRPVHHLSDHGGMISNILAGLAWLRNEKSSDGVTMLCSSDIPLLTSAMVDDFVEQCQPFDCDLYYNFITRQTMEKRFPHSTRTFVKLKGVEIVGGDMVIGQARIGETHKELLISLTDARKNAWKIARVIGVTWLLRYLFRRVGIKEIEKKAGEVIHGKVKVIMNSHAEIGMDADKPDQVALLQNEFKSGKVTK